VPSCLLGGVPADVRNVPRALAMMALVLLASCAHGSIYRGQHDHFGVRPAGANGSAGVTLQWSTDRLP
jgi:hypothetical protein